MLNELYTFAIPVQVVPFSNPKWRIFTLLHTGIIITPRIYYIFIKRLLSDAEYF